MTRDEEAKAQLLSHQSMFCLIVLVYLTNTAKQAFNTEITIQCCVFKLAITSNNANEYKITYAVINSLDNSQLQIYFSL